jgi:hypothetical protein
MGNPAFYGEDGTEAYCPVVADIQIALNRHSLPLWYIVAALRCVLEFYEAAPAMERKFGREHFMAMNTERN